MEDKHDLTPQDSQEPVMPTLEAEPEYLNRPADVMPQQDEKPPLPPEAMLNPPPRLQPSYLSAPSLPPVMQPEQSLTPPVMQPEQSLTPPVVQPEQSLTPPVMQPEQSLTPPVMQPEQPLTPPVMQPEQPLTTPVVQPEQALTPPVMQPEQSLTPPVVQPEQTLTPPVMQPEQPLTTPVVQPEQSLTPPVMQPEQTLTPPVAQPAPMLTPPTPTVPNLYPEEGFKQPSVAGQPAFQPQYGGPTPPKEPIVYASDYERIMALPPISKAEADSCRHSHEKRWYRRLIELNVLLILSVLILMIAHFNDYQEDMQEFSGHLISEMFADSDDAADDAEAAESEDAEHDDDENSDSDSKEEKSERQKKREKEREQSEYMEDFAKELPSELKLFFYGIFGIISLFITLYLNFASVKASSVKITQRNFPEIYSLVHSYAYRLGMKKVPEIYIVQQSGMLNAFSSFIFGRQYILVNTEVFEVAFREHKDMNALAFILAHELSHIYYGHATLHYNLPILFSGSLPVVGQIASRTREYSCDRLAQRLTNYDGVRSIVMLMVDRHLYPMVDVQDYVDATINEHGFFLWLVNILSSHPIMPKRIRALIQWNGSGELY